MSLPNLELGAWTGRREAFGYLAARTTAYEALCLKNIRDDKLYLRQTDSWENFCTLILGVHRATADRAIQYLDEFGADYFYMAQLIRISPKTYRAIKPHVKEEGLEFQGQLIPLTLDNTARLAEAVRVLHPEGAAPSRPTFNSIATGLRNTVRRLRDYGDLTADQKRELAALLSDLSAFAR